MNTLRYLIIIQLLSIAVACKQKPSWNDVTGEFYVPEMGIVYNVPFEVERWSIANPEGMFDKIKFLGVDNSTGICVTIVEPSDTLRRIESLSEESVRRLLFEMVRPSSSKLFKFNPVLCRTEDRWSFNADAVIIESNDTVKSSNMGYFFNSRNKVGCISIFLPTEMLDSIGKDWLLPYFDGLKILEE